jgi:hypothetical protein
LSLDVDSTSVSGTWWRHVPAGTDVLARPDDPANGRWQRGSVVEALFLADSPETAWAEWYRYLAEAGLQPEHGLPRDLWRWEISLADVADLRGDAALHRVGLRALRPTRSDWPSFQNVGETLFGEGWPALVAPSAARPNGGQVLCVFRTAKEVPGAEPIPPPEAYEKAPTVPRGLRT